MSDALKPLISKAIDGPLSREEARKAFSIIMDGQATQAQMGGLLIALRTRGETVDEYASAAQVMRERCRKVRAPKDAIDVVGTGGDGKSTLNISTATAIVVAGAGVPVAKHGNRNLSSRSGTADALSVLGVNVMADPETVETAIATAGIGFMMAPVHHPAVRHVMPVRQELGTRTVFNILGPLTNPAGVKRQLTGSFSRELIRPMAETLAALGCESAWVVHGDDGADEISISGPTSVACLENGVVREFSRLYPATPASPSIRSRRSSEGRRNTMPKRSRNCSGAKPDPTGIPSFSMHRQPWSLPARPAPFRTEPSWHGKA